MGRIRNPRRGTIQFWPRKRAKRIYARVRFWKASTEVKPLGFAGYKTGMTHVMLVDNGKNSPTKGEVISHAVTIIECPPIKVAGIRVYYNKRVVTDVLAQNLDKEAGKKLKLSKNKKEPEFDKFEKATDVRLIVQTQPKLTTIGKKRPEIFEIALGGNIDEKIKFAKDVLGKELNIKDVFKEGNHVDIHAITKGKGFQGPVKRFGVMLRQHKAEKTKRGPASLGPWHPHHGNFSVPHAGQMGYHQRLEHNKWILKIVEPNEVNGKAGFGRYGVVKNSALLVKGSVAGAAKRIIRLTQPIRPNRRIPEEAPSIQFIAK